MKKTILLVDDEPDFLKILERLFSQDDYEFRVARQGFEAMKMIRQESIDLVILDMRLPDEDGFAILQKIRASAETSSIPVIFLTGREEEGLRSRALGLGADDYVVKPFHPIEFKAKIEKQMEKKLRVPSLK
jgi:DNA-binding response OmpR family regulator